MRFQVPQFVDTEDKIIGPFTIKQFMIYFSAVMVLIPVYMVFPLAAFITIAVPLLAVAALFAHYRLHGKSLFELIAHASTFYLGGTVYIWRRTPDAKPLVIKDRVFDEWIVETGGAVPEGLTSLSDTAKNLETEGTVVQTETVEDIFDEEEAILSKLPPKKNKQ